MIATAVLLAAVFAGIVLTDEEYSAAEADAVDVTAQEGTVIYAVGDAQLPVKANEDGTVVLYGPEDVADFYTPAAGEVFKYWKDNNSQTVYQFGATIVVPSGGLVLVPGTEIITTATFVAGEAELTIDPSKLSDNKDKLVEMQTAEDGYKFLGWTSSADKGETPVYYIFDTVSGKFVTNDEDKTEFTVDAGTTMTAQFQKLHSITWVVDQTKYVGNVEEPKQPTDPDKPNYAFLGWADAEGNIIVKPGDKIDTSKITEDIVLTADFDPNTMYITLMVNGVQQGDRVEVSYGNACPSLAVPEGYAYWAVQTKAPVYAEDGVTVVTPAEYAEYDFTKAVISDFVLYAPEPDESIYATFNIEGTIYGPYKVTDRFSIPQTDREGYEFLGWTVQGGDGTKLTSAQVQNYQYTEDVTFVAVYEVVEPPAPEEPGFFETSTGKTVAVLIAFVVILLIAAVYLNLWDLRTKLFGWKIERKGKE